MDPTTPDFLHRTLPGVNKTVHRLGLAPNFGLSTEQVRFALEAGPNYVFWTPRMKQATPAVREALARDRDHYVIATGPTTGWWSGNLQRFVDEALRQLDTDYLDILNLFWVGVGSRWSEANVDELVRLRASGKVRAIGVSIHDRVRAGQLAADSPLDVLMIRYNAAHPGAEQDIFPLLPEGRRSVVAYTATRWRKLLKRPRGWTDEVPKASDCYRFCLSNPHVDVVLCGPKSEEQLRENLAGIGRGPLTEAEEKWMRDFGAVVHG